MAKRLTPEERAQRDFDRQVAKEKARLDKIEALQAARRAELKALRDAFDANLTQFQRDAIAAILVPIRQEQDPYQPTGVMRDVYDSDFIASLASQLKTRCYLSLAQLTPVIRMYEKKLKVDEASAKWPAIGCFEDIMILCKVISITENNNNGIGARWKIKLAPHHNMPHHGRVFHVNTGAERFLSVAREAKELDTYVNVQGKTFWVSPDTSNVVLEKKGLYFKLL